MTGSNVFCLWLSRTGSVACRLAATVAIGGLLTATLVRLSPGFGLDERALDPRFSPAAQAAIRAELGAAQSIPAFYLSFLTGMLRGNFGTSPTYQQPISELIRARLPVTAEIVGIGVAGGWAMAFAMAAVSILWRRVFSRLSDAVSVAMQCVPAAVMAVLLFKWGGPVRMIVALALFGRLFEFIRNMLAQAYSRPHVTTARAIGVGSARILFRHVLPTCLPEFLALAGISFTFAFGTAIPVESFCDLPGVGQLAWKAAIARDLPTLVTLAMLITLATQMCTAVADWATAGVATGGRP